MDRKHWWIMILCCLIPIVAVAAISMLGVPGNSVLYFGLFLLCPLLHLVMMRGMTGPQGEHQHRPTSLESDQAAPDRE
ncbi:MAG: DUF2933 domain-containing protein [Anaerolineae bacterium]|nr:DUF2933 domain-containing protein [Anaerolineae bacterium]